MSTCCQYRVVVTLLLPGARFRNEALRILDFKTKLTPYPWQQWQKRKGLSMQLKHHTTTKSQQDNTGCYQVAIKNSETFNNHFSITVFRTVVLQKLFSLLFYNKVLLCYLCCLYSRRQTFKLFNYYLQHITFMLCSFLFENQLTFPPDVPRVSNHGN